MNLPAGMTKIYSKLRKVPKSTQSRIVFHWQKALEEMKRAELDMTTPVGDVLLFLQDYELG